MTDTLSPFEAVDGFCAWLASTSTLEDAKTIRELGNMFCIANSLNKPKKECRNKIYPSGYIRKTDL